MQPEQGFYHGILKWETAEGKVEMREVGAFDMKNGNYAGIGTVVGGTGRFENASGSTTTYGNGKSGGMTLGTVCLN